MRMEVNNPKSDSLNVELNNLRLQSILCDTTLTDDSGQTLQAHSVVLAAGIDILKNVLTMKESQHLIRTQGLTIKIRGVSIHIWNIILDYIYLRRVVLSIPMEILKQLYVVAMMLGIKSLMSNLDEAMSQTGIELPPLADCNTSVDITLAPTKHADSAASADEEVHVS